MQEDPCRFYSPGWLGSALVKCLPLSRPNSIIDLGSGAGALADAAGQLWSTAPLVTVDIDEMHGALDTHTRRHVRADALEEGLADRIGIEPSSVDLVLSNPPYRQNVWQPRFLPILERAGFERSISTWKAVPTDLVFLAQAMHLVKPGGTLGFIVPDTMISGSNMAPVRKALLSQHAVTRVIQLPRRAFRGTDAQTFILVISKQCTPTKVRLDKVDLSGAWSSPIEIAPDAGVGRLDFTFHSDADRAARPEQSIGVLGGTISRGRATSVDVSTSNGAIFHTCNFPDKPGDSVLLPRDDQVFETVPDWWAQTGDILIARVDRRLEDKIAYVARGAGPISDCVLRLRVRRELVDRVLAGLISPDGRRQLTRYAHGTGARHVAASSILSLEV